MASVKSAYKSPTGKAAMMKLYDTTIARLPMPYDCTSIPTRYGETHVIAAGPADAAPLVLLHGWNANSTMWEPQIAAFAHQYRVYALDTIGQPGKSAPTRLDMRGNGYAEWLNDVFDGLGISRAAVVGISGGGYLTLKIASFAPERVAAAVLISSAGFLPVKLPLAAYPVLIGILFNPAAAARRFVRIVTPPTREVSEQEVAMFEVLLRHTTTQNPPPPLSDAELKKVITPTLLLMGQYERFFPVQHVIDRAHATVPGLRETEIVPDVGHGMIGDDPDAVNRRVLDFLGSVNYM